VYSANGAETLKAFFLFGRNPLTNSPKISKQILSHSSSKYNVRVTPLMLWRLATGDPLDLDEN
jgi:hypothetical protein